VSDADLSPRKAPSQQRSARTVDRIVEAAVRVFDDVGYGAATTNEIALEARVSIGSLYQYFPNKDALLVEIARRHLAFALAAFDALIADLEPHADLNTVIGTVIDLLVGQHERDRLHLLIAHEAPRTSELEHELLTARQHMVDAAARLLKGRIPDSQDRLIAAQLVVAVLDVAVHDVILRQPPGQRRDRCVELTKAAVVGLTDVPM
jgi:AcrR family transcriptional regulator